VFREAGWTRARLREELMARLTRAQADALGLAVARVFVPHPIQDRTDDELRTMADAVVEEVLGHLAGAE
jgi:hypothetical protein